MTMPDSTTITSAGNLAQALFTGLTADANFTLPAVDLAGSNFSIPSMVGNDLYTPITQLTEGALTDRTVGGTGLFDGLMVALSGHLQQEYERGRINGAEYAQAYVAMTTAALNQAAQFLLAREQSYWQAQLAQRQAQAAEIAVVNARIGLEQSKVALNVTQVQLQTEASNYALSKMQLSTADAQFETQQAQLAQIEFQTLSLMPAQVDQVTAQTAQVTYQTTNLLPKELAKANYDLDFLLPAELARSNKQVEAITAEISATTAKKDQTLFETANILPAQTTGFLADNSIKNYQLTAVLPAQVAGHTADTASKEYTTTFLLPAQLDSVREQTEGHRAKTLDLRSDGVTPVAGAIGKQKELHQQQIESYQRDAETKVIKMMLDTWITQKTMDEGLIAPGAVENGEINTAMFKLRQNLSL